MAETKHIHYPHHPMLISADEQTPSVSLSLTIFFLLSWTGNLGGLIKRGYRRQVSSHVTHGSCSSRCIFFKCTARWMTSLTYCIIFFSTAKPFICSRLRLFCLKSGVSHNTLVSSSKLLLPHMCLDIFKEQNKAELENLTELLAVVYLGIRLIISMENCDELRTVGFFF